MRKLILIPFLILFTATTFAQDTKTTTAAVMDWEAKQGVSAGLASMLSDYLRVQLVNTQKYTIVTRENMEQVLKEQNFQMSGCTSNECVVQAGQLLGVRKMFAGSVGKMGNIYLVTIKIIDVQSGSIEKADSENAASEELLLQAASSISKRITGVLVPSQAAKTETKTENLVVGKNLVENGGFEDDLQYGWQIGEGAEVVTKPVRSGSYALLLDGGDKIQATEYQMINVKGGENYLIEGFVKYVSGGEGTNSIYQVAISWRGADEKNISVSNDWKGADRPVNFKSHGGVFKAPLKARRAYVVLAVSKGVKCIFDDISFAQILE
ncbi:hypothetical protein COY52_05725 [Candidatus Desantisbacteria bacterium CG_4_10_14_0_8_um_filter_48_22]|uniref:CBM-cenC domain-containing protein n=1 Tax=Candidatus Desantisbacteria bacterium CG_4_10_14_0_8_um_filter_48_22 TaxID=1974543 RepID=A0A2M7SBM9_9BACT|nr:MAG: hypothetical protein AUJ67_06075 [Candidatus Desantisbacteria bacterium CG1_02_49_89]PIV56085.1 MAG: hypothetical protein COS16_04980 [Candidatus Desantisbacteria bacterium CG02_land_8_20_14_3_00_49_13]PIZ16925.1 MAG: hypothetical protein COY52_05725 [Candidatus Desantisbacteria bacterium CG_4_10_14_0_8_um_filter_48_22]